MSDNEPHAVRWARRKVRNEYDYTRWHWTTDAMETICGLLITVANETGTFLPDTDNDRSTVDCKQCRRVLHRTDTHKRPAN